jgi:hypothetical protein
MTRIAGYGNGIAAIGCGDDYLIRTFYGAIDELTIYDRALTRPEIQAIFAAGSAGKCTTSASFPTIVLQPTNQTIIVGDQVDFTATATSFGPESYQWAFEGATIEGATNSSLQLANVQTNQEGAYSVTVTNIFGPATSSNAVLTVLPTPPCVPAPQGLVSWWRGQDNTIDRISGNNGSLEYGTSYGPGKVGEGFAIAGMVSGVWLGSPTNLELQSFTIECWIRRADASLSTLDGSGSGYVFAFGEGGYGFGVFDNGELFLSQIGGDVLYSRILVSDTNFHHVAVTDSGTNAAFYLDGAAFPAGAFTGDFTFSASAILGARGDTVENSFYGILDEVSIYNRPLSPSEISGIYGARAAGKCVSLIPAIVTEPPSQTVDAYYPVSFGVAADGPLPLVYQWTFDGTNIDGATNSSLSFDAVVPAQAGTYDVIVGTSPNAAISSNAVLTVTVTNTPPPVILSEPASHIGVADDYTTFTVVAQSQAPVPTYYQWSWDATNLTGATNSELVISNLTLANAGTYAVQVSNPYYTTNSQPVVLTMIPAPTGTNRIVANLDQNDLNRAMQAGGSVTFVNTGTLTFTAPLLATKDVVIDGSNAMTLSGGNGSSMFAVSSGVHVALRNMTVMDGVGGLGGAISNGGTLAVSNVTFLANTAVSNGGAIYNIGDVALTSVTFSSNEANPELYWVVYGGLVPGRNDVFGGALFSGDGTAFLTNVVFADNTALGSEFGTSGYGGALFIGGGTVNIQNVSFTGNVAQGGPEPDADGYGGAICCLGGTVNGSGLHCTNNAGLCGAFDTSGDGGFGAPVSGAGIGEGGAVYLANCTAALSNGWFVGNYVNCSPAYNVPQAEPEGGAVYNAGLAVVSGFGFVGNSSGGCNGVDGRTLSGDTDTAQAGGPGAGGVGGAVYNVGVLTMTNCTLTENGVSAGTGGPGNTCYACTPVVTGPTGPPGNALGGALANFGTVVLANDSFVNNTASGQGTNFAEIYSVSDIQFEGTSDSGSDSYIVTNASAPFLALEPHGQIVAAGSTVTLEAVAVGFPSPTYQWVWNGTNLYSATEPTLVLTNAQPGQSGTYWVDATNSSGSETSAPVVVTILSAPIALTGSNLGSAGFSVDGVGIPGMNFIIEASTNLMNWQSLWTNPSPFTFVDTNAATGAGRFYRAVEEQ